MSSTPLVRFPDIISSTFVFQSYANNEVYSDFLIKQGEELLILYILILFNDMHLSIIQELIAMKWF